MGPLNVYPNNLELDFLWALRENCTAGAFIMLSFSKQNLRLYFQGNTTIKLVRDKFSLQTWFKFFYCAEINKLLLQPAFLVHS